MSASYSPAQARRRPRSAEPRLRVGLSSPLARPVVMPASPLPRVPKFASLKNAAQFLAANPVTPQDFAAILEVSMDDLLAELNGGSSGAPLIVSMTAKSPASATKAAELLTPATRPASASSTSSTSAESTVVRHTVAGMPVSSPGIAVHVRGRRLHKPSPMAGHFGIGDRFKVLDPGTPGPQLPSTPISRRRSFSVDRLGGSAERGLMSTVAEKTAARSPGPLYHLPSTITKRTCGFGFGERFPLRNIVTDSPGPGSYEVMPAPSRTLLDVASNLSVHRRIR